MPAHLGDLRKLLLRGEIDAGVVQRGRDGLCEIGAVVRDIIPGNSPLVQGIVKQCHAETDRFLRLFAEQGDGLAVLFCLLPPEAPEEWVEKDMRVTEAVSQDVAERSPGRLQLLSDSPVLVPRLGKGFHPNLPEPVSPVDHRQRHEAERNRLEATADLAGPLALSVIAPVALPDGLGDIADVRQGVCVQMRPVVEQLDDIWSGAALDGFHDPGSKVVRIGRLDGHLDPRQLLKLPGKLAMDVVGRLENAGPLQEMKLRPSGKGRRLPGCDDARHSSREGNPRDHACGLEKLSSFDLFHDPITSPGIIVCPRFLSKSFPPAPLPPSVCRVKGRKGARGRRDIP